jgi:hypothetical protein
LDWQGLEWGKGRMTTWLWGQQMGCLFCVTTKKVLTLFLFPKAKEGKGILKRMEIIMRRKVHPNMV